MTSNQLAYWKVQEDKRSNMAKEKETQRHNLSQESIQNVQNELEARGLDIKDRQLLTQLAELYLSQGGLDFARLPDSIRDKLESEYGTYVSHSTAGDMDPAKFISELWGELKDIFSGAGKEVIKALF